MYICADPPPRLGGGGGGGGGFRLFRKKNPSHREQNRNSSRPRYNCQFEHYAVKP